MFVLLCRNVFDEGSDEYKVIMLNKRFLTFRIVKVSLTNSVIYFSSSEEITFCSCNSISKEKTIQKLFFNK